MSWIETIPYEQASGQLKKLYDRVKGPDNNVDNVMMIHSLRPHSMVGHMTLYKNVLHNSNNTLPKWYLEAIGVYVSHLNKCKYSEKHHFAGMRRLLDDDNKSYTFLQSIHENNLDSFFDAKHFAGVDYARLITLDHPSITKETIEALKNHGFTEGEILEINQVASYFNYVNRMVVGLGVDTAGDILGLSPNNSDDPESWNHD